MNIDSIEKRVYYSAMKKGVDYIGVGAGAVIFNKEGKVFLAKRGAEATTMKYTGGSFPAAVSSSARPSRMHWLERSGKNTVLSSRSYSSSMW